MPRHAARLKKPPKKNHHPSTKPISQNEYYQSGNDSDEMMDVAPTGSSKVSSSSRRGHHHHVPPNATLDGRKPSTLEDLSVVDEAFGHFADLYGDVLRLSVAATHEQIQLAYFDRRSELYTLLGKLDAKKQQQREAVAAGAGDGSEREIVSSLDHDRQVAERRMAAVVLAVRILGDPTTRLQYDKLRQERLLNRRRAAQGQLPGLTPPSQGKHVSYLDASDSNPMPSGEEHSSSRKSRRDKLKRRSKKKSVEMDVDSTMEDDHEELHHSSNNRSSSKALRTSPRGVAEELRDEASVTSLDIAEKGGARSSGGDGSSGGMLSCLSTSRVLKKMSDEISGAFEDTLVSVDQVFHAFTLTDKDIRAVTKRIDKAKRQLDHQ